MKRKLLALVLSVMLFSLHFVAAQNTPAVKWIVKDPFSPKVFIENKGQYGLPGNASSKDILFYSHQNGLQYYFTPTGILISKIVSVKRPEKEIEQLKDGREKKNDDDDDEPEFKAIEQFYEMNFEGANSHDTITGENEANWYYNYNIKDYLSIKAHAWKKLTYHNLYPGIDMEFYFPDDKEGFEYSFIVHPGADISQIKIKFNGDVKLNADGNVSITSPYGNFMQYSPAAKLLSSNEEVKCDFSLSNGDLRFTSEGYDRSESLLIDPLIITPTFNNTNDAYDLDWDDAGNIYVYGGSYPWQILKYNSAGTLLWSYTTIFDGNNQYLGDFAVDRHSQSVYVTEGRDASPSGALAFKLNSGGVKIAQYGGNVDFNEMWKIAFSSCTNQAVIAGGGSTTPSYTASYLDTNLTSLSLVNTLNDTISGYHDMWDLALDNFGNSYMVTAHSLYSTLDPDSFNNVLLKLPLPTLIPTTWMVHSNYDVLEHGSLTYGLDDAFQPGNGYNGMTVSNTTLYTYDSYVLKQWGTGAGNILDSIFINGPSQDNTISWGGLTSDDCGNVFLGSINTVEQYNSSLNLVQTFTEPDTVYDVRLSNKDMLYACGIDFISATQLNLPSCHIITVTNTIKNVDCDTLGSATVTSTGGTPPYTITWNTVPVQTGNTATGLYAGTYVATIYDSSCTVQTLLDTVTILTNAIQITPNNATICEGNSAALSASGAVSTYSWSPSTGLNSTSGSSVIASPTITTTYTVIGTSAAGCSDTVQSVVTVNPAPVITITNPQAICIGSSTTLTASGAMTYSWSPSTGLSDTTGSSLTANPTATTTYTVAGTDSIGCTGMVTVIVTVNPNPTITATTPAPICNGTSALLTASGGTTYVWSPATGLSATTGSSVTAKPISTTTYTITGTDVNGCTGTTTVIVAVNPNPTITVATPLPMCGGSSTILTANGTLSYTWTPSIGLSATTGSSVTANPTTTITYTITGTDVNGCIASISVTVTVNPNPIITVATPAPICNGSGATLTANGTSSYTWTPSTGLGATTGSIVIANPSSTTTYTVTGTDVNGCTGTTSVTVTVNPNPTITVAIPAPICSGSSTTLTANGGITYTWTPSTGLSASAGSSVTANPATTTTYTITGTDVNGCSNTTTVVVTVNPNLAVTVPTPAPICNGSSAMLTANGAATYTWAPAAGLSETTGSSVVATPTITSTYIVTGTSGVGCSNTSTVVVTVNPNPTIAVTTPTPICSGSSTNLIANGAITYIWTPLTGLSASTGSSATANPTSTTTYTITGTDVNGCTATTSITLTVNPNPIITVATPAPICTGSNTTLTANGALTYAWFPSTSLSTTTGSSVTANPTITTTYTIMGTDLNGCSNTATVVVTVNPNLIVTVPTPAPICSGSSATLTASGAATYTWAPAAGLSETTGSSVTATPTITSTYVLTGTSGVGCSNTATVVVTVNPNPIITVSSPAPICNGNNAMLTATGTLTYSWAPTTGLSASTGSSVTADPVTTTTYTIIGTDVNGCIATATATLTVNPNPIIAVATPAPICSSSNTTLTANGAVSYLWTPSSGLSASTGSLVTASPISTTTYTIMGTDVNGCTATTSVAVMVNPNPTIEVAAPAPICIGSSTTLTANDAANYTWTPSAGLNSTTGSSVIANPTITTTYTIVGTSVNGCIGTTTVTVNINPNPAVIVATPAPICTGSNTSLTANGAISYTWSPAVGLSATSGSSITANPTTTTTYTIMGTDGNGCRVATTVAVTVNPNPTVTVETLAPICEGISTTLTAKGATIYTWSPSTGLSATTGSSVTANPIATSTYNITGVDINGCTATTKVLVIVNPNPTITVATPAPICNGGNTTLSANGASTYFWAPSIGLNNSTGNSVSANPTITTTYTITGTDSNSCKTTTSVILTVNPNPVIAVVTPQSICAGNNATLTANGAATYTWSPALGLSDTVGSSVIASPGITSTYTITGTTAAGCIGTATLTVTVNPNPTLTVATPEPICEGRSTALFASYGGASYAWTPSIGLNTTTGSSVTADPTTSTTYTITELNVSGCSATATVKVAVNPNPIIVVATPAPICDGSNTILTANGALTYLWTPSIGLNNSTGPSVTAYSTSTTTYTIMGMDSNGCVATTTTVVKVNPNPAITVVAPSPMCSGNHAPLIANGAVTYIWTPSAGLSNTTGASVTANPTITSTYSVTGTDGNGCNSTTKVNVDINPLPTLTVSFPPAFCKGDSAMLIAKGATSYLWSPSIGLNTTSGASVLSRPDNSVTYTVTGIGSNGCIGTEEVSVIVNPNPTVSASTPPGICRGNSQTLMVSGASTYSWSPSSSLNSTSGSSVIANPTISTTYTVIGTNEAGCAGETQVQLLVMPLPDVSLFGLNTNYCTNSSPVTLIGNPKGGTFSGRGVNSNQFNPDSTGAGTYLIKYIYTDSNGCEDSSSTTITVDPLPKVIINPNNPTVCSGIPVTLNAMGADNYTWRPGVGLSDSTSSNVTADPTITTTYTVTGINSDSCFDTAMVTVYVDSTPTASFNTRISNYCEPMTVQFTNVSDGGISYDWDFGDGTTSNEVNPQHTYKQGGTYQVILSVSSRYGCVNDTIKELVVEQSFDDLVQIGNAFTPDNNGINSIIAPHEICTDLSAYVFRVYNRWGQLLFQTNDTEVGWDGKFNGQMELVGVYDYYIEFNCGDCKIFKKGNITLLK